MKVPKEGSKKWKEIVGASCGGSYDREGKFCCAHGYEWDCVYCPVCIDNMIREDKTNEL